MSEVIDFKSKQRTSSSVEEMASTDEVLEMGKGNLSEVIVLGWDNDDYLHLSTNLTNRQEILWLLEKARRAIMDASDGI